MKNLNLISVAVLSSFLLTFNGCKKDSANKTQEPIVANTKLGKLTKVQMSSSGSYGFSITEYGANSSTVFHKDTIVSGKSYTFQFTPHVGNNLLVTVSWRETNVNPVPTIQFFYDSMEYKDFKTTYAGINIPIDWYKSINFIVP